MPTALRQTRESLMHEECSRGWALKLGEFLGGGGVVKRRRRRGSTGILGGHEGAWRHMQGMRVRALLPGDQESGTTHWDRLHKVTVPSTQPLWWVGGRLTTTPLSILSSSVAQQDCVVLQQRDHLSVIFLHYGCGDRERESTNGAPC